MATSEHPMNPAHVVAPTNKFDNSTAAADACCGYLKRPHFTSRFPEIFLPTTHLEEQYLTLRGVMAMHARLAAGSRLSDHFLHICTTGWARKLLLEVHCGEEPNLRKVALRSCGGGPVLRIGLDHGQDLLKPAHRKKLYELAEWARPDHIHGAWPRMALGDVFNRINLTKSGARTWTLLLLRLLVSRTRSTSTSWSICATSLENTACVCMGIIRKARMHGSHGSCCLTSAHTDYTILVASLMAIT